MQAGHKLEINAKITFKNKLPQFQLFFTSFVFKSWPRRILYFPMPLNAILVCQCEAKNAINENKEKTTLNINFLMLRNAQVQTAHNIHNCKYKTVFMFFPLDAPQRGLRTTVRIPWNTQHPACTRGGHHSGSQNFEVLVQSQLSKICVP